MPNIKSAIKRVKVSEKRRLRNASHKSALRTAVKAFETAAAGSNVETAKDALIAASKKLDKAVTKGLVHKNTAARKKVPPREKAERACRSRLSVPIQACDKQKDHVPSTGHMVFFCLQEAAHAAANRSKNSSSPSTLSIFPLFMR